MAKMWALNIFLIQNIQTLYGPKIIIISSVKTHTFLIGRSFLLSFLCLFYCFILWPLLTKLYASAYLTLTIQSHTGLAWFKYCTKTSGGVSLFKKAGNPLVWCLWDTCMLWMSYDDSLGGKNTSSCNSSQRVAIYQEIKFS